MNEGGNGVRRLRIPFLQKKYGRKWLKDDPVTRDDRFLTSFAFCIFELSKADV